jgi:hypothetical protein
MNKNLKLIRRVLTTQPFFHDGYEYDFLSVEFDEKGWGYSIIVNVVTPEKSQSYATPVFSQQIHKILSNIWNYIGTSFSYSEKILVNGKPPVYNGVFVNKEKQREVLSTIRRRLSKVSIRTEIGQLSYDVLWRPFENFYHLDDVYIDFDFNIEISNLSLNNQSVTPNLEMADEIAGAILNLMFDTDSIREEANNVIYNVMSDEIDIVSVDDLYYQVIYYITKIDGFEVKRGWGTHYDLVPEMFT